MPPGTGVPAAVSVNPHQHERKNMRKTISVAALLLALTCPAYAGEIQNDVTSSRTNTAEASADVAQEPTADGIMGNEATDSLTQTTLDLLALLPSLL